mgnify:CR=1 FL=1
MKEGGEPVLDVEGLCKSFGALEVNMVRDNIDVMVSSSNKCVEGIPGFSYVLIKRDLLLASEGNSHSIVLDLFEQWKGLEANGQFRFTPPTHALVAFRQALREHQEQGRVDGIARRYDAQCRENHHCREKVENDDFEVHVSASPVCRVRRPALGNLVFVPVADGKQHNIKPLDFPYAEAKRIFKEAIEDYDWKREVLESQRGGQLEKLASQRHELSHLEDHLRRLQDDFNRLRNEAQAIMTGKLGEDGVFYAEELLLKCPTKYEEAVPEQAATN